TKSTSSSAPPQALLPPKPTCPPKCKLAWPSSSPTRPLLRVPTQADSAGLGTRLERATSRLFSLVVRLLDRLFPRSDVILPSGALLFHSTGRSTER
ncbi:hypothetical protein FRC01_010791, partial [Tulasnella sp. 417]